MTEYDLGTARGKIEIDAKGAIAGTAEASAAVNSLDKSVKSSAMSTTALGVGLVGIGTAMVAGLGYAIKLSADFDKKMSSFKAVTGATGEEMDKVREKALQLGADTVFSADEAGQAMVELGKNGLSVTDIINGAADATVYLAAAGEIDLPQAAAIASAALNQFKLKAEDLPKVADLLAGAANASATGVSEIGLALTYVGPIAAAVGFQITDVAGAIALLANNGIDGEKAGTALRAILGRLQPASAEAGAEMKKLGLITADGANAFYDAQGKIKPMRDIIDILNKSMKGLTKQQQQEALQTIFGTEALSAAAVMAGTTQGAFDELQTQIGDVSAQDVANERMNNLSGSLEQLKGSLETALIKGGKPFQEGLKAIVDWLTKFVNWLGDLNPEIQKWIGYIIAGVGAVLLLTGGVILAKKGFDEFKGAIKALNLVLTSSPWYWVVAAIAAIAIGLKWLYDNNETFRKSVDQLWENFQPVWDKIKAKAEEVWNWLKENVPPIWDNIRDKISTAWQWVVDNVWPKIWLFGVWIYNTFLHLKDWFEFTFWPKVQDVWNWIVELFNEVKDWINLNLIPVLQDIWKKVEPYWNNLVDGVVNLLKNLGLIPDPAGDAADAIADMANRMNEDKTKIEGAGTSISAAGTAAEEAGKQANASKTTGWNPLVQFMIETLIPTWQDVWNFLTQFSLWYTMVFTPVLNAAGGLLIAIWNQQTSNLYTLVAACYAFLYVIGLIEFNIGNFLLARFEELKNTVIDVYNTFKTYFDTQLRIVVETWKGIIEGGARAITGTLQAAEGLWSGDWTKVWQGMQNIMQGQWQIISSIATGIWNTLWNIFENVLIKPLRDSWTVLWNNWGEPFRVAWRAIEDWFNQLPGKFTQWFANAGQWLRNAGAQIINGLWNGLWSAFGQFNWGGIGTSIKAAIEQTLGIKSPSKVMMKVGEDIVKGMALGMESEWSSLPFMNDLNSMTRSFSPYNALSTNHNTVVLNFNFGALDPSDRSAVQSIFGEASFLNKITNAARAGVGMG